MLGLDTKGWRRLSVWVFGWPIAGALVGFFGSLTYSAILDGNARLPSYTMAAETMLAILVSGAGLTLGLVISLVGARRVYFREIGRSRVG